MAQLSSKVTFAHVPYAFISPVISGKKGCYIDLAPALLQVFNLHRCISYVSWMRLTCIPDAFRMHSERVLHVFQMRASITLELSCTVSNCDYAEKLMILQLIHLKRN